MKTRVLLIAAAVAMAVPAGLAAQRTTTVHEGRGGSPHIRTEWVVDGANLSIEYGRPHLRGRPEAQLMPPGQVWRTGADEATTLKTDKALRFGSLNVPAGTYTLWTVPGASAWQLVVSKEVGQWGTAYNPSQDLGRAPMRVSRTSAPVEQLTISIVDTAGGGTLRIEWGATRAEIDFTVG